MLDIEVITIGSRLFGYAQTQEKGEMEQYFLELADLEAFFTAP